MNKFQVVKKIFSFLLLVGVLLSQNVHAQCPTDINYGKNLVVNGNFSNGYTGWTFTPQTVPWNPAVVGAADGYRIHNAPSLPGDILVGTNPNTQFNNGFQTFGDHTTGSGNFLMVDGVCKLGVKLFSQNVTVAANTNYYFSVWINSLKDNPTNPGVLNFDVGGANIGANIVAPAIGGGSPGGGWIQYEVVWFSGAIAGNVAISIENQNTLDCGNQVDFAIDDIAFIPGCGYGSATPQPNLGPDQSFCGKGGSILLNSGITPAADMNVTWHDGTGSGIIGAGAAYTKTITAPGTYYVCVTKTGSCAKTDTIVVTNTFSIQTGGPYTLCSSTSQTLDAGFTGIGVTYKWYKDNILVPYPNDTKTYTGTSAGTYRVDVTVPGCGTQSSTSIINSTNPITPIDAYYCATSGPVSGLTLQASGTNSAGYTWFTTSTGGSPISTGPSYVITPDISQGTTTTLTYYVQDNAPTAGTAGSTTYSTTNLNTINNWSQSFAIVGDVTVNSLQVPFITNYSPGAGWPPFTITVEILNSAGASFAPAKTFTSNPSVQSVPGNDGGNRRLYTFPFTGLTISSSFGTNLRLKLTAHTHPNGAPLVNQNAGFSYPINSSPTPAITINGAFNDASPAVSQGSGYAYFYNWNISSKFACSRTPVRAISNCPQPVTWTSFYLVPQDNSCKIIWGTANEINNHYFSIERSSDGINFTTIGTVSGAGNRDYASNYYFVDEAPIEGTSYYRITQHDLDGTFTSTQIKPYHSSGLTQISTYPNPFQQTTTLIVTGSDDIPYTYTLYSVSGQLIETGTANYNVPVSIGGDMAKGMYMLTVTNTVEKVTTKIVKQ